MKTIEDIKNNVRSGFYKAKLTEEINYDSRYIEDENKSVKWNQEFLETNNLKNKQIKIDNRKSKQDAIKRLKLDLLLALTPETSLNENQIKLIIEDSYFTHQHSWLEAIANMRKQLRFIEEVINAK